MRLWIMDEDETPQRFPLQRLLRAVVEATGTATESFNVRRAMGYGARVQELAEGSDAVDVVQIAASELDELSCGTEEWFFDIDVEVPGTNARFGLHDSTALFVEAERHVLDAVAAEFAKWRLVP